MGINDNFFVGQRVKWNDPGLLDYEFERAVHILEERFPDATYTDISDFVTFHWDNLEDDDANVSTFVDYSLGLAEP